MLTFQQAFQQDDGTPGAITWECPYFDLLPQLAAEDFAVLKADILARGQQYSILWRAGSNGPFVSRRVLDGFHRLKAVLELLAEGHDVKILSRWLKDEMTPEQEEDFVLALNLKRRHLTPEQRQEWVVKLRQKNKSIRQIADTLGVGVATVHRDLSTVPLGTVELPSTIKGDDGKERAATKPRLSISTPEERTNQTLYDEAEAKRAERKGSNNATFRAENSSVPVSGAAPSVPNPITENKAPTPPQPQKEEVTPEVTECREHPIYTPPSNATTATIDARLHYHSCPACFKHDPCSMDCAIEPDAYDEKTGRRFGATCRCDECGPEVEECDDGKEDDDQAEEEEPAEAAKRYVHWNTPPEVGKLLEEFGTIDLDPCSNEHTKLKAAKIFTAEDDGLSKDWGAYVPGPFGLIYVNPPYSTAGQWARKCAETSLAYPDLDIVLLVPARTGARWFHDWVLKQAAAICWWRGRIQFWKEGKPVKGSANFDPCFAMWGPSADSFHEIFGKNFKGEPNEVQDLLGLRQLRLEAAE